MVFFLGILGITLGTVTAYYLRGRTRGLAWNRRDLCTWCAGRLESGRMVIDGHEVCGRCGAHARWRLGVAAAGSFATAGVVATSSLLPLLRSYLSVGHLPHDNGLGAGLLFTIGPAVGGLFALRRMKDRNRQALQTTKPAQLEAPVRDLASPAHMRVSEAER